jgi:membrane protein
VDGLQIKNIARGTIERWVEVEGYRLGASLAFYALMSFVPLVVIGLAALEIVLGGDAASRWEVLAWVDATGSTALKTTVESALAGLRDPDGGVGGIVVGVVGALIGASGVFAELDTALNRIFGSEKPTESFGHAVRMLARDRLSAFVAVIVTSLIVLVATVLGTATVALGEELAPRWTTQAISFGAATALLAGAMTLCIHWVPATPVRWKSAALGGIVAAVVLQVVRLPFAWAIVRVTDYPMYGVLGSVLVVLMWMWVAACILLLGASAAATFDERPLTRREVVPAPPRIRPRLAKTEVPKVRGTVPSQTQPQS